MVIEKESHGRTGTKGTGADVVRCKTKGAGASKEPADTAEKIAAELAGDHTGGAECLDSTQGCGCGCVWDRAQNAVYGAAPAQYGAKDWVARSGLGATVHFPLVLLVNKGDGDKVGLRQKVRVVVRDGS